MDIFRSIEFDPPSPKAGQQFQVKVRLNQPVAAGSIPLTVLFEKQRLKDSGSGFLELRPTGPNYFEVGPQPIEIQPIQDQGTLSLVVQKDAKDGDDGTPIVFPDNLAITCYLAPSPTSSDRPLASPSAYAFGVVRILPVAVS
ncbi:MAG TPA: hypothetical protein VGM54_05060 [Chthoniobacter sp.]|jgi:hypothetical protein